MAIIIEMTGENPPGLRAQGSIWDRKERHKWKKDIVSRHGVSTEFELSPGECTYVFGIDREGSFVLCAVDAATGHALGEPQPYTNALTSEVLRYHFRVS